MKLIWKIDNSEVSKIRSFVEEQKNPFVEKRIARNLHHSNIEFDNNTLIHTLTMCLLTSQQRSGPNSPVSIFLRLKPFPFTIETLILQNDIESFIANTFFKYGLKRYLHRITKFLTVNFAYFQTDDWQPINSLLNSLLEKSSKEREREVADILTDKMIGIGPKQSRNFLQSLGLSKYEIPFDSRITGWLNDFGFPVTLSSIALQDKGYYHFVSDGIQELCSQAGIYPCVLDAAIFSSFDDGRWNEENVIY